MPSRAFVTGYLITIDGRGWSRLTTRGMRDEWEQRESGLPVPPGHRLRRPSRPPVVSSPAELSVASLMLKAAFGALPKYGLGWTVRYVNGDKGDCTSPTSASARQSSRPHRSRNRFEALPWARPLGAKVPFLFLGHDGPKLADDEPELRRRGFGCFEVSV